MERRGRGDQGGPERSGEGEAGRQEEEMKSRGKRKEVGRRGGEGRRGGRRSREEERGGAVPQARVALHARDAGRLPSPSGTSGKLWGPQHTRILPDIF